MSTMARKSRSAVSQMYNCLLSMNCRTRGSEGHVCSSTACWLRTGSARWIWDEPLQTLLTREMSVVTSRFTRLNAKHSSHATISTHSYAVSQESWPVCLAITFECISLKERMRRGDEGLKDEEQGSYSSWNKKCKDFSRTLIMIFFKH